MECAYTFEFGSAVSHAHAVLECSSPLTKAAYRIFGKSLHFGPG